MSQETGYYTYTTYTTFSNKKTKPSGVRQYYTSKCICTSTHLPTQQRIMQPYICDTVAILPSRDHNR